MNKAVLLTGPFTEADLARFAQLLREVERGRGNETFGLLILDEGATLPAAYETVLRIFPQKEKPH